MVATNNSVLSMLHDLKNVLKCATLFLNVKRDLLTISHDLKECST